MNDYIYGAVSGIFQTIIGHPFDTKKVLMQNNKILSSKYFIAIKSNRGIIGEYPF